MKVITDLDAAHAEVGAACTMVEGLRAAKFWRFSGRELLDLAAGVERLGRLLFAAQVEIAGEMDAQSVAADHGSVSTAALLRQPWRFPRQMPGTGLRQRG